MKFMYMYSTLKFTFLLFISIAVYFIPNQAFFNSLTFDLDFDFEDAAELQTYFLNSSYKFGWDLLYKN